MTSAADARRVLVTGATGFVGGHVLRGLADDGWTTAAVVRASSDAAKLDPRATLLRHDGSTQGLIAQVAAFAPDAVVHAASKFVAEHRADDIDGLIEANLRFGCQLLEAMHAARAQVLVDFGTAWQHYDPEGRGGDTYRPVSLYAATKQAFQDLVRFYADAHGLRAITLKLSDTYGRGDPRKKVVALFRSLCATGATLAMSPGEQAFNLTHVEDVVQAVSVALKRMAKAPPGAIEAFSVRGAETMTLREFAELFAQTTGEPLAIEWGARPYRAREVMHAWAGELLPGWTPQIPLAQGLADLVRADV